LLGVAAMVGCLPPQPKSAEDAGLHEETELARLSRENVELEGRLRQVQSERDAARSALDRCRGVAAPDGAAHAEVNPSEAGRDLPVVRLVPEAESAELSDSVGKSSEGRLVLRASGDGQGEISNAPADPDNSELPPESGVRFSEPEDSAPTSPSKPQAPAENSTR
jgi:hypothetical protein